MNQVLKLSIVMLLSLTAFSMLHPAFAAPIPEPGYLIPEKTDKEYVQLIKDMYADIQKIGLRNCTVRERTWNLESEAGRMPVDQRAQRCVLSDRYTVKKSTLDNLWETGVQLSAYFVNEKLFFAFIETSSVSSFSEQYRFYFAPSGRLIQVLVRRADSDAISTAPNTLVTDQREIDENLRWMKDCLKETDEILNGSH